MLGLLTPPTAHGQGTVRAGVGLTPASARRRAVQMRVPSLMRAVRPNAVSVFRLGPDSGQEHGGETGLALRNRVLDNCQYKLFGCARQAPRSATD